MNFTKRKIESADLSPATARSPAATGTLPVYFVADWALLEPGDIVWVRRGDGPANEGTLDALMEDGSVLWICPGRASTRRMIHRSDGEEIWSLRQIGTGMPEVPPHEIVQLVS